MKVRRLATRSGRGLAALLACSLLAGCATTGDPEDPFEDVNRAVYSFNDAVDRAFLKPVAEAYDIIVPGPLDVAVTNFFGNLGDVTVAVNSLLQMKLTQSFEDGFRVAINTTFGLLGFIDFAADIGIEKNDEDFGQTLGYWGVDAGPYLVLPLLGPSSARDAVGLGVDRLFLDPIVYVDNVSLRNTLIPVRIIDRRSDLQQAQRILKTAALDEYLFVRDAYLQRRETLIADQAPSE